MRKVFFSFHYSRDINRIGQIRNAWVCTPQHQTQSFLDKAEWESIKRQGNRAVQNWIDTQMKGTSVTIVLIGAETYQRPWVQYEIAQSVALGKGLLGICMHGMKDLNGSYDQKGDNPFNYCDATKPRGLLMHSPRYPVYSWINDNGRANLSAWIEQAARAAGRT